MTIECSHGWMWYKRERDVEECVRLSLSVTPVTVPLPERQVRAHKVLPSLSSTFLLVRISHTFSFRT